MATRRLPSNDAEQRLRDALALALRDLGAGRAELRDAQARLAGAGDEPQRLVAAAAQVLFIGIADDDYTGFEAAVRTVMTARDSILQVADAEQRLLARAGSLMAAAFANLDDPALPALAHALVRTLAEATLAPPVRCCAGLSAAAYFRARNDLESLLLAELAMRALHDEPALSERLADESHRLFVQALYACESPAHAEALRARSRHRFQRRRRRAAGPQDDHAGQRSDVDDDDDDLPAKHDHQCRQPDLGVVARQ